MHKKTVLDNGLRVITETMPYLKSATIGIWTDIGSRNESRENNGFSHFVEHMVFKGTKTRSALDIATVLESLGGSLNAFTGRENTCYYARVLDAHLPIAAEILSDLLSNSTFQPQHVRLEKKVVLEEIKDSLDTPSDHVHDLFARATWKQHPLGLSILGSLTNIRSIKRDDLLSFYRKNYTTENTVVAAAGKINHNKLVRQIDKLLKIRVSRRKRQPKLHAPVNHAPRSVYSRGIKQCHIVLGWEIVPYYNKDRYPLLMLNNIMGGGMSSRMFQVIRENAGLAYSVFSFQDYYKDTGILGIYLGCDPGSTANAVNLLVDEVEKIKSGDISDAEFSSTKLQLSGNLMLGLESSTNRMNRLARNEMYLGRFITINETIKNLEKVRKNDLIRAARKYLNPESASLVVLGPVYKSILKKINL
ncbi:MAG: insulinase family protein [candidate division Zixibacteria bacterium]|nr:insulinase family protein [candidate division Zixibacteria bacterium]